MSISISEHRASKHKPSPRRLPLRIEHRRTNLYLRLAICLPPHKPLPPPCRLSTSAQTSKPRAHTLSREALASLIFPFLDLDIKYFDLGILHRDATDDNVTVESAEATLKYNVAIKCATITPGKPKIQKQIIISRPVQYLFSMCSESPSFARMSQNMFQYRATDAVIKGPGKLKLVFEGKEQQIDLEVFNFTRAGGVAISMYNTDMPINAFAASSMATTYEKKWPLYLSTKNTILKKYDGRFKDIFQEVYEAEWKSKFEAAGIWYEHRLIDDMVAYAVKSEGGYVWACKNYDGDVQSDFLAQESSIEERSKELKSKYETASKLEKLIKEIYEKIAYLQNVIALLQKKEVADAVEKADKANAKNVQLQELIAEYQYCNVHGLDWRSTSQLQELYIFLWTTSNIFTRNTMLLISVAYFAFMGYVNLAIVWFL
ncbi:seed maturation protein PM41 [Carex littledalei]|uniref:Seed maturation protein PM41 n=1 Tax=Carex littledalei TaxID=544730 RepID=A0A833RET5_9POAL|nr:seed maturation protein PM41 [Carex littledalei]